MSEENTNVPAVKCLCETIGAERLAREFQHLKSEWSWLLLYGVLLTLCGAVGIVVPALAATAAMVQLLVGVLYLMAGFAIFDTPVESAVVATLFVAAFFIVVGGFRILAAMMVRFPHWGWALLNGVVTFLLGMIIYRLYHRFPASAILILGLLVGIEMLLNGWTWIMLSLAIRNIPDKAAA